MAPRQPVLVTGGAGDIGSHMFRLVRAAGHRVVADHLSRGCPRAVRGAGMRGWRPRHQGPASIVRTAWEWQQRLRTRGRPAMFGAAHRALPIAELGAR
jgi:nucleoside-diphosphate-sugar epimerase